MTTIEVRSRGGEIYKIDGSPVEWQPLTKYGKGQYVFRIGETVLSIWCPRRQPLTIGYLSRYASENGWDYEFVEARKKERVIR